MNLRCAFYGHSVHKPEIKVTERGLAPLPCCRRCGKELFEGLKVSDDGRCRGCGREISGANEITAHRLGCGEATRYVSYVAPLEDEVDAAWLRGREFILISFFFTAGGAIVLHDLLLEIVEGEFPWTSLWVLASVMFGLAFVHRTILLGLKKAARELRGLLPGESASRGRRKKKPLRDRPEEDRLKDLKP